MSKEKDRRFLETDAVFKDKPERGFTIKKHRVSTDLAPDEVLIKVLTTSFCGTDYHIYAYDHWAENRLRLPLVAGHEFSGEIIKTGTDVTRVKTGDIVSAETHIICGECEFCKRGEGHICENTQIIGVDRDGCFAGYIKIPAMNCIVNDAGIKPSFLSVMEPLGNAVHTMAHFDVKDKDVVVLGCGPIGLMGIDVAKAYGARKVIAIEINDYRRNLAREVGADVTIDPTNGDVIQHVLDETNQRGADVIGEFSGSKPAIEQAFKYLKRGGKISMLGLPNKTIEIDFADDVVFKGIEIYGVVGRRIYETWDRVLDLLKRDALHLDTIITHEFKLSEINEAAELMGSKNCGKIIMYPEGERQ